jgi:hypothetical protein
VYRGRNIDNTREPRSEPDLALASAEKEHHSRQAWLPGGVNESSACMYQVRRIDPNWIFERMLAE